MLFLKIGLGLWQDPIRGLNYRSGSAREQVEIVT